MTPRLTTVRLADGTDARVDTAEGTAHVESERGGWWLLRDEAQLREAMELAERAEAESDDEAAAFAADEPGALEWLKRRVALQAFGVKGWAR